ncbi:MAG: hypothetical protein ACE5GT_00430 [Rhodospirillales bacterium]
MNEPAPVITPETVESHGLSEEEYRNVLSILGRGRRFDPAMHVERNRRRAPRRPWR